MRRAAYQIIAGKGATYYGIGSAVARIVDVLLHDQRAILTVCSPDRRRAGLRRRDAVAAALVGGEGVLATIPPPLDAGEREGLRRSAAICARRSSRYRSGSVSTWRRLAKRPLVLPLP